MAVQDSSSESECDGDVAEYQSEVVWGEGQSFREVVHALVGRYEFEILISCLVVTNCIFIGWQSDVVARDPRNAVLPSWCIGLDTFFCVLFVAEIALRLYGHGQKFITMPSWRWNIFDLILVCLQTTETLTALAMWTKNGSSFNSNHSFVFRILRIFRIVRIFRVIRFLHGMTDLRLLIVTIFGAVQTLMWVVALLLIILYAFSVFLTGAVTYHRMGASDTENSRDDQDLVRLYFR